MAKTLTAKATKLNWILQLSKMIPPSKITNDLKFSSFRRAIKLALAKHTKAIEDMLSVFREDSKVYNEQKAGFVKVIQEGDKKEKAKAEKELKEIDKALVDLQNEANKKIEEYSKENDNDTTVTFDNEAFDYTKTLFGESAKDLFGQYQKDAEGNIKQEAYNSDAADELFSLLDEAK